MLAYDTASEVELMCKGGTEGVREAAGKVASSKDCNMLSRLLSIVEGGSKKFDATSCQQLIEMLTKTKLTSDEVVLGLVNRTLRSLSPSVDPSGELYETMLAAVDRFSQTTLSESIMELLSNREDHNNIHSFLRKAHFILELKKRPGSESNNYLEKSIQDLTEHGSGTISKSAEVNSAIFSMIEQHGWEAMEDVVKGTLAHLKTSPKQLLNQVLNRANLLWKCDFPTRRYDFIQSSLVEFASDFVSSLESSASDLATRFGVNDSLDNKAKFALTWLEKFTGPFMTAVMILLEHGDEESRRAFGDWATSKEEVFSALLKAVKDVLGNTHHSMVLELLNKCLVHVALDSDRITHWPSCSNNEDSSHPSSIHIRKTLEAVSTLANRVDDKGRLPLHWAVAANASYEVVMDIFEANRKGATVQDPLSGLYGPRRLTYDLSGNEQG